MNKILYILILLPVFILIGCSSDSNPDAPSSTSDPSDSAGVPASPQEPDPDTSPDPATPEPVPEPTQTPEPSPEPAPKPRPVFGFIDTHADTISRALQLTPDHRSLYINNELHVDFKRLSEFEAPVQVFVAWCAERYVATAFEQTNKMFDFFEEEVARHSDLIEIALDLDDIVKIAGEGKISAILAIEGGEALMGEIGNLDHFYERGVRIIGLTWNRENALGFGHATGSVNGLKPFGKDVVKRMDELGMIVDVSHLNVAGFWDVHEISTRPYMASHSNVFDVMPNARNLTDDQIMAVVESGGIIGFNMYPPFISSSERASTQEVMAHFRHYISIGAGNNIGLGCDFDGINITPLDITDVLSLKPFKESLIEEFDDETAYKIMEGNFYEFFVRYFEG